jgi:glycine cleavage system transcriptional repressor
VESDLHGRCVGGKDAMTDSSPNVAHLVLSAIGTDRPGIVDEISQYLFDRNCNIEDSRMAVLGGEFAVILLVGVPVDSIDKVQDDLDGFRAKSGLRIHLKATAVRPDRLGPEYLPYRITGTALDHPGIVYRMSHLLHQKNVNIESLDTRSYHAPMSGSPMFHFEMIIAVPAELSLAGLKADIAALGDKENIDCEIHPVTG